MMITELDRFLKELLTAELDIQNGEIDIQFAQPVREWSGRLSGQPTINLFLYDLRENNTLRHHDWQSLPPPDGRSVARQRTPYRIDCHYLLTTWVNNPEDEHQLLTACLLALLKHPVYRPQELEDTPLAGHSCDLPIRTAAHDTLTNPAELWSSLDNEIRPSIAIVATIALNPWTAVTAPAVRLRQLHTRLKENNNGAS